MFAQRALCLLGSAMESRELGQDQVRRLWVMLEKTSTRACPATARSTVASGHVLPLPVNNLERRCPDIFSSRIGSGHVLYCFVFVLPLALESDAALLVHEDFSCRVGVLDPFKAS